MQDKDEYHGFGRLISIEGSFEDDDRTVSLLEGYFQNNYLQGYGRSIYYNGSYFEGLYLNG